MLFDKESRLFIFFFCSLFGIFILSILYLNSGFFTYILDDPYIHLAMAENYHHGHYGVNLQESSSPSSSILWPVLLALGFKSSFFYLTPLLWNILFSLMACLTFIKVCQKEISNIPSLHLFFFAIFFSFLVNVYILSFTGLENVLHIFLTVLFASLLIQENKTGYASWFLVLIAVLMVSVRYESMAVIVPSAIYLWFKGHRAMVFSLLTLVAAVVLCFALFLHSKGLPVIPSSLIVKSAQLYPFSPLKSKAINTLFNFLYPKNLFFIFLLWKLYQHLIKLKNLNKTKLFYVLAFAFLLQCVFGKSSILHLNRYEAYMNGFFIVLAVYLGSDLIESYLQKIKLFSTKTIFYALLINIDVLILMPFIPVAAHNIYEQQYQMHNFATKFYNKNVAVNDLGYVSFQNDNYVLDLYGLSSVEAFKERLKHVNNEDVAFLIKATKEYSGNTDWMVSLTKKKDVHLAMIYKSWFKIPRQWRKLAELRLSGRNYTAADSVVSFYLTGNYDASAELSALRQFKQSLPSDVTLEIFTDQ